MEKIIKKKNKKTVKAMNRVTVICKSFKQSNLYVIYLETLFRVLAAKKRENRTEKKFGKMFKISPNLIKYMSLQILKTIKSQEG